MDSVRVSRKNFITPRCTKACPAEVDVPRYIRAVKDGRYDDAIAVLREKLPLPIVCADACFAPCEDVCAYKQFGDPIAIRALKRAAVDNGSDTWKQQQITARDIQTVLVLGVTFKGNVTIGKDLPLSQIHADHDALLIATGAKIQIV
jgi:NADPH-dependent glutamate synthase beta subunit-like oxidoreductase